MPLIPVLLAALLAGLSGTSLASGNRERDGQDGKRDSDPDSRKHGDYIKRLLVTSKQPGHGLVSALSAEGIEAMQINTMTEILALSNVKSVQSLSRQAGILMVELENSHQAKPTFENLRRIELVESVEYDTTITINEFRPSDPLLDDLWGMDMVKAPTAWETVTGTKSVVVCVSDTGVDYNHKDLAANMWQNPGEIGLDSNGRDKASNGIDDDGNGIVDDVHGMNALDNSGDPMDDHYHGTHCAGTLGAVGNNGVGVVGVAHEVSIMACKFINATGHGVTSGAIKCLDYALQMGATLTSNSYGADTFSLAMSRMIDLAQSKGQLFVASAGNSATDNDLSPNYPSSYPQDAVIAVASVTSDKDMSYFSCFGKTSVDLGAPGSRILSTTRGNRYQLLSGTSMATPHVAGALALMYSYEPGLGAEDAKRILLRTGSPLLALSKTVTGKQLDVAAAIAALMAENGSPGPVPVCEDDPTYLFKGRAKRGCKWIARKPAKRCKRAVNVIGCPVTCGACDDDCQDDNNYRFRDKRGRGCKWIAKNTNRRCRHGVNIIGCPDTCGICSPST